MAERSRAYRPADLPCPSCPYRRDVPSGVWTDAEYDKLPGYDESTPFQPVRVFMCHQQNGRLCAGWVGCHDVDHLLSLRIAVADGSLTVDDMQATADYVCPVELWGSGAEAAEHGKADVGWPDREAREVIAKVTRRQAKTKPDADNLGMSCREDP